ncbi:carcinoembryonic antigen-related cell adhesion molecule 21-like isoform X2 [Thalassophryne amazonica]|nr:carcinoembryonic antigen-related cell adhesion molecule 21-like isoform X2 [Thalassophryne amazonica]XP_034030263.1 carcinoembryonic antigen-related cell adhesion molecule 21-like isoform X2 [Thalassophryne amazonica]
MAKKSLRSPPLLLPLVCCLCVNVAVSDVIEYTKMIGDKVVLSPGAVSVTAKITRILWKHGSDMAVDWDGLGDVDAYRQFRERGSLNLVNGELTITGLSPEDNGEYTPEINGQIFSPVHLKVFSRVPKPVISVICNDDHTSCSLKCIKNGTYTGPLVYNWKIGDQVKKNLAQVLNVTEEDIGRHEFSCELENPVSRESSDPVRIATIKSNVNIHRGIIVFIALLTAVAAVIGIHRWKTGEKILSIRFAFC